MIVGDRRGAEARGRSEVQVKLRYVVVARSAVNNPLQITVIVLINSCKSQPR